MEIEIWKDIDNYPMHQVSNKGRIRNIYYNNKISKTFITRWKYESVNLMYNGKTKSFKVHRLVALAFILNPENKPYVNHIDGNKMNNNLENLEWVTPQENVDHAIKIGLFSHVKYTVTLTRIRDIQKENNFILVEDLIKHLEEMLGKTKTVVPAGIRGTYKL